MRPASAAPRAGSSWSASRFAAYRSPSRSTRASTASASNASAPAVAGVEGVGDLVPRDGRRHHRSAAGPAASRRRPSSCAGRSGSSRRTPGSGAASFAMLTVTRSGARLASSCPSPRANAFVSSAVAPRTGHGEVQALAARRLHDADAGRGPSSVALQLEGHAGAGEHVGGRPRGRGRRPSTSGGRGRRPGPGGCGARARRGSPSTPASAASSTTQATRPGSTCAACGPTRARAAGSASRRTSCPRRRSGTRTIVTARPARWGSITGAIRRVVVDDRGLREPGVRDRGPSRGSRGSAGDPRLDHGFGSGGHVCEPSGMPSTIWTGSISFGLVAVPVKVVSATKSRDVRFNQLEEGTNAAHPATARSPRRPARR